MSNHTSITGLKSALAMGVALIVAGCNLEVFGGRDDGRVRMILAPEAASAIANIVPDSTGALLDDDDDDGDKRGVWWFQTANVTLSSILVRTNDGKLTNLNVTLPITVDLVQIDGGKRIQLPDGVLPVGSYDQVVLVISAVQGVAHDGTVVTIDPPGGGWTAIIPICSFAVAEGQTTTVGLGLNVRNSFLKLGNWWSFQPRFRSLNNCAADN